MTNTTNTSPAGIDLDKLEAELFNAVLDVVRQNEFNGVFKSLSAAVGRMAQLADGYRAALARRAAEAAPAAAIDVAAANLRAARDTLDREQARAAGSNAHIEAANQYQFAVVKLTEAALAQQSSHSTAAVVADDEYTVLAQLPDIFRKLREAYRRGSQEQGQDAAEYAAAEQIMRAWDLPDAPPAPMCHAGLSQFANGEDAGQPAQAPIYQVQYVGEYASSVWHDASEDAYHTFMPERRRIVYAAPPLSSEQQATKGEPNVG
jgi:hypothetical protein